MNQRNQRLREIVYERALAIALTERGLRAERQQAVTVWYHERPVGTFRADLIVEGKVLIELKALPRLELSHVAQVLNQLRATGLEVGLLLNFGAKPEIKQLVATKARGVDQR